MAFRHILLVLVVLSTVYSINEARYLPTRSQDDRIDRLRDLLRDLLENEFEMYAAKATNEKYERAPLPFKREMRPMAGRAVFPLLAGDDTEK